VNSVAVTQKPLRPDFHYLTGLTRAINIMRIVATFLFASLVAVSFLLYASMNKAQPIAVVDMSTGQTRMSLASGSVSDQVIEQQLIYYARQFCEDYLTSDFVGIVDARKRAVALMHPDLSAKLPADFLGDAAIAQAQQYKMTTTYDWLIKPSVITKADPRYSVFCQFVRVNHSQGYAPQQTRYNIRLDFGRILKNTDPFNRPHSLVLLNFETLDDNKSKDLISKIR
jgi:hypothetical protein